MSLYILDTDTLSLYQREHPAVVRNLEAHPPDEVAVTIISVEEQISGWYTLIRRSKTDTQLALAYQRLTVTVKFLADLQILPFTEAAISRFHQLRAMKLRVGTMDLRIAAIALEHGGTVVTRNLSDFERIPGLACEDWSR
jgi:tRNA(fMet)-specific endonuclease VapC